jgi:hypothetical protein
MARPRRHLSEERWLEIRREAGRRIDPATCEETWIFCEMHDPYGLHASDGSDFVGREDFYRSPGGDVWVHWRDLPEPTQAALSKRGSH